MILFHMVPFHDNLDRLIRLIIRLHDIRRKYDSYLLAERGVVLAIEGKPGSGKTSLLSELVSQLHSTSTNCMKINFVWIFDVIKSLSNESSKDIHLFDLLHDIIEYLIRNLDDRIVSRLKKDLEIYSNVHAQDFWRPVDLK